MLKWLNLKVKKYRERDMTRHGLFELILSLLILTWVICLTFFQLFLRPYPGFSYTGNSGAVVQIHNHLSAAGQIQVGDKILAINRVVFQESPSGWDFSPPLFSGYQPGDVIPMTIDRNEKVLEVQPVFSGPTWEEFIARLNSQWPMGLFFWLAGAMTLLFIRPRTLVSALMALFFYLSAFWLSAGVISQIHVAWVAMAMRVAIWLTIPIYWHFLWYFPTPLGKLPRQIPWIVYSLGCLLAVVQTANLFPPSLYLAGFALALLGSLALIVLHAILHRSERKELTGLLIAAVIVLGPTIVMSLATSLGPAAGSSIAAVTGFSALPGYFFLTLIRGQVAGEGRLIPRLMRMYLAAILVEMVIALITVLILDWGVKLDINWILFLTSFLVLLTMMIGFAPFLILPALSRTDILLPIVGERPLVIRANRLAGDTAFFLLLFLAALALFIGVSSVIPPRLAGIDLRRAGIKPGGPHRADEGAFPGVVSGKDTRNATAP